MSYFEDLSPHVYTIGPEPGVLNVGWLDRSEPFPTGETSQKFQQSLEELCKTPIHLHRGFHVCDWCRLRDRQNWGRIGNGQIRVAGNEDIQYVAPTMIFHYVSEHHYLPPEEFIAAVLKTKADADSG